MGGESVSWLPGGHVLSVRQFDRASMGDLMSLADRLMAGRPEHVAAGRLMASIFYEPSTRTRLSFEAAMAHLGGAVISTENAAQMSSAAKGESLRDTIRIISGYADVIVLRHHDQGSASAAAAVASVPVINAGDGPGEHPTQALLDAYTINRRRGALEGLHTVFLGDSLYGRTVHSLCLLLRQYPGQRHTFVSPPEADPPAHLLAELAAAGVDVCVRTDILAAVATADVLYVTRVQKERFADPAQYQAAAGRYRVDQRVLDALCPDAMILHPLPRLQELPETTDADPRAAYFQQAKLGIPVRMALLGRALGVL